MARIEIGEYMPVSIVGVVHGHIDAMAGGVGVFFEGEAVVLLQDGFAEFAAVRLGNFDVPGIHRE